MAIKYTTTLQLGEILGIVKEVPSWDIAATPTNEAVGTGNSSNTQFFLDQRNIIASSYTLYANASAMTETTHYTLNKDTGEITLTAAGVTLLSTNALTAKYKYFSNGMSDSFLNTTLLRAEAAVDQQLNTAFTDGSVTNPAYPSTDEIQASEGFFADRVIINNKPLIDITTTLNGSHTAVVTTITLATGAGSTFPTAGYIIVGSEVIAYTGTSANTLTGCTRGSLGTTAAAYTGGETVHSTIFFRSDTDEGTAVSWTVQPWDTSMYASEEGLVYKFKDVDPNNLDRLSVANRVRIIYYYGFDTIPYDITRLSLLIAKRMLITDNIGKAMIAGRNEFRPEMLNADQTEIQDIIAAYRIVALGNT